jgi:hypothetical protein
MTSRALLSRFPVGTGGNRWEPKEIRGFTGSHLPDSKWEPVGTVAGSDEGGSHWFPPENAEVGTAKPAEILAVPTVPTGSHRVEQENLRDDPAEWCSWAPLEGVVAWVDRPDVRLVVEDLANEGQRPRRIVRDLGLHLDEVRTILRSRP